MSSGSFKDLSKAISHSTLSLPLPDDLLQVIEAYLEKHSAHDEFDSQKLQEELLNHYQSSISDDPSKLAPFLAILRKLKPALRGSGRLLQWWDKLSGPILVHVGVEKGLAIETRKTLLGILAFDEDDEGQIKDAQATSDAIAQNLLATWLIKTKLASEEFDDHAKFVETQIQAILIAFGKKKPKDLLMTINKFFVKKDARILALSLLCDFFRHQPPHLHQLLQTPLFDNLLRCLQIDTSTRVISLAMMALIMFLPHIPNSSAQHLPALFNIYTRLLFWDRERKAVDTPLVMDDDKSESSTRSPTPIDSKWDKLAYLLESEDESVPELLHYFTFLYGLYPINFMSYIRKPQRYLRHAKFPGADDLDIQPMEIRQRSEPFRQVHLLHPNFFMLTIESELTDNNRWKRSEAADVVAECMALYVPSEDGQEHTGGRRTQKLEQNSDVPDQPLLDEEAARNSWRDTRSTATVSPTPLTMALQRKASQTSQSMRSVADSPYLHPSSDSPIIPAQMLPSPSHTQLTDLINSSKATRGGVYQTMTNESVASLALSNNHEASHIDTYLASISRDGPKSPSLRPTTTEHSEKSIKLAYLHREIQLLKNDLNFERYLKQQHLSHIGQLRRKQIREARVEAETQNLINSNRSLKMKLDEAKHLNLQIKKETEKSRTHSRKWEADLTAKLRILREEQKKWNLERAELKNELQLANENVEQMRQIIIETESRELRAIQKSAIADSILDELEKLRKEVDDMKLAIRSYEARERVAEQARENEKQALATVTALQNQLRSRDNEVEKSKQAMEDGIKAIRTQNWLLQTNGSRNRDRTSAEEYLDSSLTVSQKRYGELQKAHTHILNRYNLLQESYFNIQDQLRKVEENSNDTILSGYRSASPSPAGPQFHSIIRSPRELEYEQRDYSIDSHVTSPPDRRSPVSSGGHQEQWNAPQSFMTPHRTNTSASASGSMGKVSLDDKGKVKIKPESEQRIYGRGGVQNIRKKDVGKDKENERDEPKKEKRLGIKGLRSFGGS